MKITKKMTFKEVMDLDEGLARELSERGLFCGGCPFAAFETIEQGCIAHGLDPNKILKELNETLIKK